MCIRVLGTFGFVDMDRKQNFDQTYISIQINKYDISIFNSNWAVKKRIRARNWNVDNYSVIYGIQKRNADCEWVYREKRVGLLGIMD